LKYFVVAVLPLSARSRPHPLSRLTAALHGQGIGTAPKRRIVDVARSRKLSRLVRSVLRDNTRMMQLVHDFAFAPEDSGDDEATVVLRL
jgi:GNAT superfamily N-acetyltransferase